MFLTNITFNSMQSAPLLCYGFHYLIQWTQRYNTAKSCKPFRNAKFWESCRWVYTQQNDPINM